MAIPTEVQNAPELRQGSNDTQWIEYLQRLLITADGHGNRWPVSVDGDFGKNTVSAVKAFQRFCSLPETGVVDSTTWEKLYEQANSMEGVDETMGQIAGDERAADRDGPKLDAGHEIERTGWRCVTVNFILRNFLEGTIDGGQLYARFEAADGAQSDEYSVIDDGSANFHNVWVPDDNGRMWLYINHHRLGELQDGTNIDPKDNVLSFTVEQKHNTKQVTVSEAVEHGWMTGGSTGATVSSGIDVGIVSIGGEIQAQENWQTSDGREHSLNEVVVVRLPLPNLDIKQTG